MRILLLTTMLMSVICINASCAYAEDAAAVDTTVVPIEEFTVPIESIVKVEPEKEEEEEEETVYFDATLQNFSKTYWRLLKFDIEDDKAIDNYMRINECNLYNEFIHNEFEWSSIRAASRNYLETNKKKFPLNYKFVQPISLGAYDFEAGGFHIAKEFSYNGQQRFEMPSEQMDQKVCGTERPIPGYPRVIALELTRPFIFNFFEIDQNKAKELIDDKMKSYENLREFKKSRETFLAHRRVYLVTKLKMFAYKKGDEQSQHNYYLARILAVLEGVEVYADPEQTQLLYKKDYRQRKIPGRH